MQRVAQHLARFVAYVLVTAPREMLRYALHDQRFFEALFKCYLNQVETLRAA